MDWIQTSPQDAAVSAVLADHAAIYRNFTKPERYEIIRAAVNDDRLWAKLSPAVIKACVDGAYGFMPNWQIEQMHGLARRVAQSPVPITQLGRGSVFAKLTRKYRQQINNK